VKETPWPDYKQALVDNYLHVPSEQIVITKQRRNPVRSGEEQTRVLGAKRKTKRASPADRESYMCESIPPQHPLSAGSAAERPAE
jgi:hypothetical protein